MFWNKEKKYIDISHVMCPVRYAMVDAYTYTGYAIIVRGITTLWQFVIGGLGGVDDIYSPFFYSKCQKENYTLVKQRPKHVLQHNIDGLVQDSSNSIANALELLQSCIKSSILIW